MQGSVVRLFLKPGHGLPMREVQSVSAIAGQGLEGDASFGRSRRQVLLVDQATLEEFELSPGQTRENIVLGGLALDGVSPGTRLIVGDVVLVVTSDATPCSFMDAIRPGLREAIRGRRGLLARVERGGVIHLSDPVRLHPGPAA
jgi:MOSC domain-containing protein YiiM